MIKLIFISIILCLAFSIEQRTDSHLIRRHLLDGELCQKRGGFVCGFVVKDCCVKGCYSIVPGINEKCIDDKHLDLSNVPDCK